MRKLRLEMGAKFRLRFVKMNTRKTPKIDNFLYFALMFYMPIRSWGANASTRSGHTGVWVPVHEIESTRSESARWNTGRNSKKPVPFLFLFFSTEKARRRRWTLHRVGERGLYWFINSRFILSRSTCSGLQRRVVVNDNFTTLVR